MLMSHKAENNFGSTDWRLIIQAIYVTVGELDNARRFLEIFGEWVVPNMYMNSEIKIKTGYWN